MKPRVIITNNYSTTDYTVVKYLENGLCIIKLDHPFPEMPNFPEKGMSGCYEFVTALSKEDYRNAAIDQLL